MPAQPPSLSKHGEYLKDLEGFLEEGQKLSAKRRRSAQVLFEDLVVLGYEGGYDSVRRYVSRWRDEHTRLAAPVFIPLRFGPGQAFQFDWSEDHAELAGGRVKVNLAHIRLCHSRMFLVQAYPRQSQEMLFDAHRRGFDFFGGVCSQGIYDNPKTMLSQIKRGKKRVSHPRFSQLCSHYLYEPVFCTPGAAWGRVRWKTRWVWCAAAFSVPGPRPRIWSSLTAGCGISAWPGPLDISTRALPAKRCGRFSGKKRSI
ncbi:MAG: IS21 family transposase [Desulfarculaceae bacterium]|nr:IS21 family transposase [Desulfarculaceae bacterium]